MLEKVTGIYNVDELAKMLKLPPWEQIDEHNVDYICENGEVAYREALKHGKSEEEAEDERMKGQEAASDERYAKWYNGVTEAAEYLLRKHGLTLVPRHKNERRPYEYHIRAYNGWRLAAVKIVETINGVGMFEFGLPEELVRTGPYATMRQAVLQHVHWIKDYPAVYGTISADQVYEQSWR